MNEAKLRGKVLVVEATKTYGQKGFRKRLVVLEEEGARFTNIVPFEFVQDNCDSADGLNVGDDVEMTYRLSGRKWQKDEQSEVKYFLNAEAISFKVLSGSGATADPTTTETSPPETTYTDDDIPF